MTKSTLFVFAVVLAVAVAGVIKPISDEDKAKIKKVHEQCQTDPATHLDESITQKLKAGEKVDDPKVGAHLLCISKKAKLQNDNGDLNTDYIKTKWAERYDGEELTNLHKCLVQEDTPEKTATHLFACQRKVVGEHTH